MCNEVEYNGKLIETQGDLIEAIGKDKIMVCNHYSLASYDDPKGCLCPVDLEATAKRLNCTLDKSDPFIWVFKPKTKE